MIYAIINQSHEWDEPIDNSIDFVSTSLEKAEEMWEKSYSKIDLYDDSKWCCSADLREYPDGYFLYGLESSRIKVLKHVDNVDE